MMPPGVARPWAWVARSNSPQVAPPAQTARRRPGSTVTLRMPPRSITRPPSQTALPAAVAPAPHRQDEAVLAREPDAGDDVLDVPAAQDRRRPAVDHAVVDTP